MRMLEGVYMMNSSMEALREAQMAFKGEAERLGLKNEDDVADMVKRENNHIML